MRVSNGFIALLAAGVLSPISLALAQDAQGDQAAPQAPAAFEIDEAGWTGGAVARPGTGLFSHCVMSREYDSGMTLVFSVNPRFETNVGLLNPEWELVEGEESVTRIVVDDLYDRQFPAVPTGPTVITIPIGANPELIQHFMRGSTLTVTTEQGEFDFPLTGTFAAFGALEGCIQEGRRLLQELERQEAQAGGPSTEPMTQDGLIALLQQADLAPFGLVAPEDVPDDEFGLGYMWQLNPTETTTDEEAIIGALHQERRGPTVRIDTFADRFMRLFEARCDGTFERVVSRSEIFREFYALKTSTIRCTTPEETFFSSLVFVLDNNNYTVFLHQSGVTKEEETRAATAAIEAVLRREIANPANETPDGAADEESPADGEGTNAQ